MAGGGAAGSDGGGEGGGVGGGGHGGAEIELAQTSSEPAEPGHSPAQLPRQESAGSVESREGGEEGGDVLVGAPTKGHRVQRVSEGISDVPVEVPPGATTALKKMYTDQAYYDAKSENQAWSSRLTFILASIGCAVGVGNIWRFPYMCYRNGGAAFLIPYFISLVTLGYPLFVLETSLGQGTGKSPVGALGVLCPRLKGLAWLGFSANACITCYYMVVLSWSLRYMLECFTTGPLPFSQGRAPYFFQNAVLDKTYFCSPPSNTTGPQPYLPDDLMGWARSREAIQRGLECRDAGFRDEGGLQMDNVGMLLVVWLCVLGMVFAGTKSLKYSVYVTLPLPYIVLVIMFFRGITLEGAGNGIRYYVTPDISILFNDRYDAKSGEVLPAINIWLSAASHIFYSLGLGQGMLITYASYNPATYPIRANSMIVAVANSATEIFGGFATFSILGYLAEQKGVDVSEVVAGGPGLVFESIPEALSLMPAPGFFSFLFFFMLFLLGISSAIGMFEAIVCVIRNQLQDKAPTSPIARYLVSKHWILPVVCSILIGLPGLLFCRRSAEAWIDLVDGTVSFFLLSIIGVGEFVAVAWVFGIENYREIMLHRTGYRVDAYVAFIWRWWGPALLTTLFLFGIAGAVVSPVTRVGWALAFGWLLAIVPFVFAVQYYIRKPNHDGETLSLRSAVRRRRFQSSAPLYERAPWKVFELFTAQGKENNNDGNDPSVQGTEMQSHHSDPTESSVDHSTTPSESKKGQSQQLLERHHHAADV